MNISIIRIVNNTFSVKAAMAQIVKLPYDLIEDIYFTLLWEQKYVQDTFDNAANSEIVIEYSKYMVRSMKINFNREDIQNILSILLKNIKNQLNTKEQNET